MSAQNGIPREILIVDDNADLRRVMSRTLQQAGYGVTEAADGRAAQALLEKGEEFDAIISDIRMPGLSGLDLLYYVKQNFQVPFIIVTAFTELLETRDAFDIGADGFICKPFKSEELKSCLAIALHLNEAVPEETRNLDSDFVEIDIQELAGGNPLEVDMYMRLSSSKYVKVASSGTVVDSARIKSYAEKGVSLLYFKKT